MTKGILFDVVHGSFTDGRGVRTVIFFKGCNLRCRWCHNPESIDAKPQMMFYKNRCTNCNTCKAICPQKGEKCNLCGRCEQYCPSSAKKVCGKIWTLEEVMDEIQKDETFYKDSDGGVTFSGGECMLQIDFLKSLLMQCQQLGIHTAVDTAGHVAWESFEKIIPYTNTFLYDFKCFTEKLHKEGTGVSNKIILSNLEKLSTCFNGEIIIRVPIIPSFNTDFEELEKIAKFLKKIKHNGIEFLPYHKLGENKYSALTKAHTIYPVPTKEEMEKVQKFFIKP